MLAVAMLPDEFGPLPRLAPVWVIRKYLKFLYQYLPHVTGLLVRLHRVTRYGCYHFDSLAEAFYGKWVIKKDYVDEINK